MKLPFADRKGFEKLPGQRASCVGYFRTDEINHLLETKERKVLGTAARFLRVSETEIVQIIPVSSLTTTLIFAEKEYDEYEYGDEDEDID